MWIDNLMGNGGIRAMRLGPSDDGWLCTLCDERSSGAIEESLGAAEEVVFGANEGEFHAMDTAFAGDGGMRAR